EERVGRGGGSVRGELVSCGVCWGRGRVALCGGGRRIVIRSGQTTGDGGGADGRGRGWRADLRAWGMGKMGAGGKRAKRRTIVAVARKLAVLLHHLWATGEVYDPLYNRKAAKATAQGKRQVAA